MPHLGQLEDLATFDTDDAGIAQIGATPRAGRRRMGHHRVGLDHLGQVLAFRAGLLARTPLGGAALRPIRRRWLGETLGGGRHRGIPRVAPHSLLELGDLGLEFGDLRTLLLGEQMQCGDELPQLLIGGRVVERRAIVGRKFPTLRAVSSLVVDGAIRELNSYKDSSRLLSSTMRFPTSDWVPFCPT